MAVGKEDPKNRDLSSFVKEKYWKFKDTVKTAKLQSPSIVSLMQSWIKNKEKAGFSPIY